MTTKVRSPIGLRAFELADRLYRIPRSLTGEGVRRTLDVLSEYVPLNVHEIPSGTRAFDWTVPPEWNVREAWIRSETGQTVCDFEDHRLHLVGYSEPVDRVMSFEELDDHLHVGADPGAIPYRTEYYSDGWGFCLTPEQYERMDRGARYHVHIDADLCDHGSMTVADDRIEGTSGREYLLSTYCCHPQMANDNLSGLVVAVLLMEKLREYGPRHSWRLVIAPETVGVLAYWSERVEACRSLSGGYVLTCCGHHDAKMGYKASYVGDRLIDRAAKHALPSGYLRYPFRPAGSDERQYASPGFRVPTGSIVKGKYHEYPEYHTSKDDLSLISADALEATFRAYWAAIMNLERNVVYRRREPHGEYKLDRHGLYPSTGKARGEREGVSELDAARWIMHGCDGITDLLTIAERSGVPMALLHNTAERMREKGLLEVAR